MVIAHDVLHLFDCIEASIDQEVQMRERLLQLKDPRVLEWRDRSVLLRVETLQVSLACVNDEFLARALCAHNGDEVNDVFPLVEIIDTQAALNCDRNVDLRLHLGYYASHKVWVLHQHRAESTFLDFIRWATTVYIHLIIAELLDDFGCLTHGHRIVATKLTYNWVLVVRK